MSLFLCVTMNPFFLCMLDACGIWTVDARGVCRCVHSHNALFWLQPKQERSIWMGNLAGHWGACAH